MKTILTTKIGMILVMSILIASCGDPIFSIKHTLHFEGSISHSCMIAAAKAIDDSIFVTKDDDHGERDFDGYIISNDKTEIYAAWLRSDRRKIELSIFGIGFVNKERDIHACELMHLFKESLIDACGLDRKTITVNKEYIRSSCE